MDFTRFMGLTGAACATLLTLSACSREGQDQMTWARTALERNDKLEIVATDPQSRTFTVRMKDTGELRMVGADQVVAGPGAAAVPAAPKSAQPPKSVSAAAESPGAGERPAAAANTAAAGAPATPAERAAAGPAASSSAQLAQQAAVSPQPGAAHETPGGRVLEQGPGYTIKAAAAVVPATSGRMRDVAVTSAAVERRHEPIVCQGSRLLHIDNRNLEFEGDAVSAQDGCEIHITNSHISATGVGVSARAANVHIDNSLIEGDTASIDASDGAQIYAASTHFKGLSRRGDTATFHDLGGNIWN